MKNFDPQVPFINAEKIIASANAFRKKHWDDSIPVDIEKIIELGLSFDIIPVAGLMKLCNIDALVAIETSRIYADYDVYIDERYANRLRFSYAHEIGHTVLHRSIYINLKISTWEDYYEFFEKIPQKKYQYLETQANMFAGALLIPSDRLIKERDIIINPYKKDLGSTDDNTVNQYIATPLSKMFGVSYDAMYFALTNLKHTD